MATMSSTAKVLNNQSGEKFEHDEMLPLAMTYLTPDLIEMARTQLNETDEVREEALKEFRNLIDGEDTLSTPTDDLFLLAFLRCRKFNVKKAFKQLKNYWSFTKDYSHIYDINEFSSMPRVMLHNFLGVLPYRDRNGSTVLIFKLALWEPEQDSYEDIFRTVTGLLNYAEEFPATQIAGIRSIFDIRCLSTKHLKYITPYHILLYLRATQSCFPGRFTGMHILTDSRVVKIMSTIIYPMLASKLKKRVFIHNASNMETIKDYIHPSVLPVEFGGEAPEFDNSNRQEEIEKLCQKINKLLPYGYKH